MPKVNETPVKGIENYVNLNFDSAKNSEEVEKTIFELAQNAERDLKKMQKSDADKYKNGIDDRERMDIYDWLSVIGDAVKAIPSKFKTACTNSINKLREAAVNLTKSVGIAYENDDSGIKVNIDKEGNGTVVFKGESEPAKEPQQTAAITEPEETDAEQPVMDRNTYIKQQAYAYMRAVDEISKKLDNPKLSSLERARLINEKTNLMNEYIGETDDASDIKLFRDYCDEYRTKNVAASKNNSSKIYTKEYEEDMLEAVLPKEEQSDT
jgi:hypothetical protein